MTKINRIIGIAIQFLCVLCLLSVPGAVQAVIETYEFSDDSMALRYKTLSAELRCPKCQNQNIADSNAPIAQDLRKLLHKQLEAGASDDEILEHMVARYGEFVRYKPRFSGATLVLWLMPAALLFGAIVIVVMILRGSKKEVGGPVISAQESIRLDELLASGPTGRDASNKAEKKL